MNNTPHEPAPGDGPPPTSRFERAMRLVAGDLPPTSDLAFTDPEAHVPGTIDKRLLLQDTWWIDNHARWHRLTEMSPQYRSNVLSFVEEQAPTWITEATVWVILEAISDAVPPAEASQRLELLDLLTPGWTGHSRLGQRLHQLNGTHPSTPEPPRVLLTAGESNTPQVLRDTDKGTWQIRTLSETTYLIDLDQRRIRRDPREPHSGVETDGTAVAATPLPLDHEWTQLVGLVQCRVGRPLVVLDARPHDGYRVSTLITDIERVGS